MERLKTGSLGLAVGIFVFGLSDMTTSQSADRGRAMLEAAARGDVEALKRQVSAPASLRARDAALTRGEEQPSSCGSLPHRCREQHQCTGGQQDSPWLLAGALGRTEMLRLMIPKGPDFSLRNRFGGNALIPACERAHVETVKLLLTTKIDVNHVNNLGWTCLLEIVILGDGGARHVGSRKACSRCRR